MEEKWNEIPGFEMYEISNKGRIRCWWPLGRATVPPESPRLMTIQVLPSGYHWVHLRKERGGKRHIGYVHRLVLLAFVGPCPEGQEACHNDGDKSRNEVGNLRWDTKSSNQADRVKHGTSNRGSRNGSNKLTVEQVMSIREGRTSAEDTARKYKISETTVRDIRSGRTWGWLEAS